MGQKSPLPSLDVAVTLIRRGPRVLMILNASWSAFTLPMTKRREWQDPNIPRGHREESWVDAAARAAGECLGRTFTAEPVLRESLPEFLQSNRSGVWNRYYFQVFEIPWPENDEIRSGAVFEWLTPAEILDEARRPISPTARHIIARLQENECFE
jgi:hypothetical protein